MWVIMFYIIIVKLSKYYKIELDWKRLLVRCVLKWGKNLFQTEYYKMTKFLSY